MNKLRFEYKITFIYLITGGLWILFSDKILVYVVQDIHILSKLQTFKGWFYVIVTALLFFAFLKNHLSKLRTTEKELENHKVNLEQIVSEKTSNLDAANRELSSAIKTLHEKNDIINQQNSELKETLQNLRNTQAQLHRADKMATIGVLSAGIAHEINNPLNYILGGLTGLEEYLKDDRKQDENVELFLESIKTGLDRAVNIVSGLNQISDIRGGYNETCNIHKVIDNCLIILNYRLKKGIVIVKDFMTPDPIVNGNMAMFHQAFLNVLINAHQSIELEGKITIETKRINENVNINIEDTGCGIEREILPKITDPFFTTKEPGKGTGLGLSITYSIIKEFKGEIEFESEVGKGTIVNITLPLKTT